MPQFTVTAPNGKKYDIKAPDGTTADQAMAYAKKQFASQPEAPPLVDVDAGMSGKAQTIKNLPETFDAVRTRIGKEADNLRATHPLKPVGEKQWSLYGADGPIDREGLPWEQATEIMASDNPSEQRKALALIDPKATLESDMLRRQYVKFSDGRRIYVEPIGDSTMGKLGATAVTTGEQMAARPGATVGSVAGGIIGDVPGAALGGAAGNLLDQFMKKIKGTSDQTPGEVALNTAKSGAMAGLGEGVARIPGAIMRGGLPKTITRATDETNQFAKSMMGRGATPSFGSGAPGLASVSWKVALAKKLGLPENDGKVLAMAGEIEDFLAGKGVAGGNEGAFSGGAPVLDAKGTIGATKTGGTPRVGGEEVYGEKLTAPMVARRTELAKALGIAEKDLADIEGFNAKAKERAAQKLTGAEARQGEAALTGKRTLEDAQTAQTGQARGEFKGAKANLTREQQAQKAAFDQKMSVERAAQDKMFETQMNVARGEAERSINTLRTGLGRPAGDLQATVAGDIEAAKSAAGKQFQTRYAMLDRLESGLVANMSPVSKAAKNILDGIERGPDGNYLIPITEVMAPKLALLEQLSKAGSHEISVGGMANLRTSLYQLGGVRKLMGTTKQHLLGDLFKAADESVKNVIPKGEFGDGLLSPVEQAARLKKIGQVRENIETDYAAYKKKFDDVLAQRLVKEAGTRGSVDAENVISLATSSPNQFRRVWNLVTPETKTRISRGLLDDMVGRSMRGGRIDAQAFVDQLGNNSKILREVFGNKAPQIIQAARGLLAVDGKLPNQRMMPENVLSALKTATKTQEEMDRYFSKNSLALMAAGEEAESRAVQEAKRLVQEKAGALPELKAGQTAEKRALADRSAEESAVLRDRIAKAGATVEGRADKRLAIGKAKADEAKETLNDFDQTTFGKLADPNFLKEGAVNHIIQPGKQELLEKALGLYGPGSEQVRGLQEAFLRKAVASGTRDITDPRRAFGGEGIRDFLKGYTPKQKDILLEPYGGEEGLQKLSRFMDFAFPASDSDVSAALAGGSRRSKVGVSSLISKEGWKNLARYGKDYFVGYVLSSPQVYKLLVTGFDYPNTPVGKAALKALDNGMRVYVQTSTHN